MPTLIAEAAGPEHRHCLWLPHATITLTLPMPSGECYVLQVWRDPLHQVELDNRQVIQPPAPAWIQTQLKVEHLLPDVGQEDHLHPPPQGALTREVRQWARKR